MGGGRLVTAMRDTRDPILVRWDYSLVGQSTILKSSSHIRETISHRIPVTLLGETIENIEIGIRRIGGQDTGRWEGTIKCIVSDLVGRNKKWEDVHNNICNYSLCYRTVSICLQNHTQSG